MTLNHSVCVCMCVTMVCMTHITHYLPIEILSRLYRCCQFILKAIIEFKYKIVATILILRIFIFILNWLENRKEGCGHGSEGERTCLRLHSYSVVKLGSTCFVWDAAECSG